MTFLHRLLRPRQPRLEDLYAARQAASDRLQRALERGDTREQHAARMAMQQATHAALKGEVRA